MKRFKLFSRKGENKSADNHTPTPTEPMTGTEVVNDDPTVSLAPTKVLGVAAVADIDKQPKELAFAYRDGEINELFGELEGGFGVLWTEYLSIANTTLGAMLDKVRNIMMQPTETAAVNIEEKNTGLRAAVKAVVTSQMDKLDETKNKIKEMKDKLRDLGVGIMGNPDLTPRYSGKVGQDILETTAAFLVALSMDLAFMMGLLRSETNRVEAIAFSFAVSIFGSLTALWSATLINAWFKNNDARAERARAFPNGIYPDTKQTVPEVFPLGTATKYMLWLSHILFLGIVFGTAWYRNSLGHGRGALAGSIGIAIVLVGFYCYKVMYGKYVHPRAAEHEKLAKEIAEQEASVATLGNFATGDAVKVFADYEEDIRGGPTKGAAQARNTLLRIIREARTAPRWFTDKFADATKRLVDNIGDKRKESNEELDRIIGEYTPSFVLRLDVNLDEATRDANALDTKGKEITGRIKSLAEILPAIVNELKDARDKATKTVPTPTPVIPSHKKWVPNIRRTTV